MDGAGVKERAAKEGITERTLDRAKTTLGIQTRVIHDKGQSGSRSVWNLPPVTPIA
jgi:hypothetical protein